MRSRRCGVMTIETTISAEIALGQCRSAKFASFTSDCIGQRSARTGILSPWPSHDRDVIAIVDRLEGLVPAVQALGRRHVAYGVTERHYETVGAALLWTLEKGLGWARWAVRVPKRGRNRDSDSAARLRV